MQEHQCVDGNVELWADIKGYEGRYQVSSLGRIKSLARMRRGKSGCEVSIPEKIMVTTHKKDNGRTKPYAEVRLRNGGLRTEQSKCFLVHRLVAGAFIKPLEKGEQVDHINGVHYDNRVENLRIMHYTEHARLHPMLVGNKLQQLGLKAVQEKRNTGWTSGQYERTKEMRIAARLKQRNC